MRRIDTRNPVEWRHPLNAGRVLWLAGLPQWSGGATWHDLTRRTTGVTLVGPGSPPDLPDWTPTPYGAGLLLDGSTQYADGPTLPAFATGRLAAWFKPAAWNSAKVIYVGNPGSNDWCYFVGENGGGSWQAGVSNFSTFVVATGGTGTLGVWTRIAIDYDGATLRLYADGQQVASQAGAVVPSQFKVYVGQNGGGVQRANGVIADPGIWATHAPDPAAWAAADYEEGRRNYPTLLQRVRRRAWASVGGGTTTYGVGDTGVFAMTGGPAVGLTLVAATTGSLSLSGGTAAGLSLGATGTGSVTVTGGAAVALSVGAGESGGLSLSGGAAAALSLAAAGSGTLTLAGGTAVGLTLVGGSAGTFTLTGGTASGLFLAAAGTGVITLTGGPAVPQGSVGPGGGVCGIPAVAPRVTGTPAVSPRVVAGTPAVTPRVTGTPTVEAC